MEHNLPQGRPPAYLLTSTAVRCGCPGNCQDQVNPPAARPAGSVSEAEDIDGAGVENLDVRVIRVELGDEGGNVGDGRGVVGVLTVEHDVGSPGVAAVADPEARERSRAAVSGTVVSGAAVTASVPRRTGSASDWVPRSSSIAGGLPAGTWASAGQTSRSSAADRHDILRTVSRRQVSPAASTVGSGLSRIDRQRTKSEWIPSAIFTPDSGC